MDVNARKVLLLLGDVALLFIALLLSLIIRYGGAFERELFSAHIAPFTGLYVVWLIVFYVFDLYDLRAAPVRGKLVSRLLLAMLFMFFTGVTFFYAVNFTELTPKTNLVINVLVFGILAFGWRLLFSRVIAPLTPWRIGILGTPEEARELARVIGEHAHLGYQPVVLGADPSSLLRQIEEQRLHAIVMPPARSEGQGNELTELFYRCLSTGVVFLEPSQAYELFARRIPLITTDRDWFVRNLQERSGGLFPAMKRGLDITAALLVLIITSPIFLLAAFLIKLGGGEGGVFYTQERVGKNGKRFLIKKFRTMRADAERDGAQWAAKNDARVTGVGRLLRWTHLDELPQMLNVLKGDISFVGPRPERPEFVAQLEQQIPHYHLRQTIRPGFTGWAQIRFRYARSVTDSQMKFEYDLYYMKNRSFLLDALIILKTVQLLFRREE